jgi:dTMP kinase
MKVGKIQGKLIVIDGTDGSGKATQVSLLTKHLEEEGHTVKIIDFPEYEKNFFGEFIGHCLTEQRYNFKKLHPKIASIFYAADRWESSTELAEWLKKGYIVIANRYVSANQIHQGGKIKNAKKRRDFLEWLDKMEYEIFGIPRPNLVLYLSVPTKVVRELIKKRDAEVTRNYKGKKKDVHESDIKFLDASRESALKLVKELNNFVKIDCAPEGELLSRETIHEKVMDEVEKIIRKK